MSLRTPTIFHGGGLVCMSRDGFVPPNSYKSYYMSKDPVDFEISYAETRRGGPLEIVLAKNRVTVLEKIKLVWPEG